MERLSELGLKPAAGRASGRIAGYLAGSDGERAGDLSGAFLHDPVQGVLYARGGYGTTRLLPLLDLEAMAGSRRLLAGYSDATALGLALSLNRPFPFLHGPSVVELGAERPDHDEASLRAGLFGGHPDGRQRLGELETLNRGDARGIVLGGCLSVLCALLGTPFMPGLDGRILFLEDVNEEPYRLDRMLTQLFQSGRLDGVAGLLLGRFTGCEPADPAPPSRTAREVLEEFAGRLGVPALAGLPAGHGAGRVTIPLGVEVELDGDRGMATFHHR
jgi:muramoyltetrapeptide carboxypeptidase